ncbi:MAG: hypothetical protein A2W03_18470 [Candidatus Aminicenantes bacterium RBG_16_63_16]|nr:MAG: hypothetical protein A2W03_18470 [Candidatus Aminicenantes bacterium RBG_16_63_16]
MKALTNGRTLLWAALAAAVLASCAPSRTPAFEPALSQSRQYFQAGEYQKAIDVNASSFNKHPRERAVREEYIRTLEGIEKQARAAMSAENYASAERLSSILLDNYAKYKGLAKSLSFSAAVLDRRIRLCRAALEGRRIAEYLQAGEYDKALGTARALSPSELKDPGRAAAFGKTMEDIKRRADLAAESKDYIKSGRAYAALARRHDDASKLGLKLPFSREALAEGLKVCRSELTRRGLELYRKGELSQAIALWEGLLQFDPDNAEIRKAVETAREQQKKLQKGCL